MKKEDYRNDFEIKYQISQEEIDKNPEKAKENFLKNISENEELRKELWTKLYWDMKGKLQYRNNKEAMLKEAEESWHSMTHQEKEEWYDFVTDNNKSLGVVGELNFIAQLVKMHKGNMKKVWKDLKIYGNMKKENNKENESK